MNRWFTMASVAAGMFTAAWVASAQEAAPKTASTGLHIVAGQRLANADARRSALGYTTTPLIDVTQPRADVLIVNMTGMASAGGLPCEDSSSEVAFDLSQAFTVVNDRNKNRPLRLMMEAQLIGLFRGNREGAGTASMMPAEAVVTTGGVTAAHVGFPGRSHTGKDILFVSERSPAVETIIGPGEFNLSQKFSIRCSHPKKLFHKNVMMAMFGDAGRMPEWVNLLDPSRDLPKNKDFGFRVSIRIEPAPAAELPVPKIPTAKPISLLPPMK